MFFQLRAFRFCWGQGQNYFLESIMFLTVPGAIGVGLVWGWLMGNSGAVARRPALNAVVLSSSTLLVSIEIVWLAGWWSSVFFLAGALFALLVHLEWRRELHDRIESKGYL